jgi:hypothetical protein
LFPWVCFSISDSMTYGENARTRCASYFIYISFIINYKWISLPKNIRGKNTFILEEPSV